MTTPLSGQPYRVQYRSLMAKKRRRIATVALASVDLIFEVIFFVWLLQSEHYPSFDLPLPIRVANLAMVVSIGLIELFRVVNVATLFLATMVARDPIPVMPEAGTKVAYLTTIVPGKEPIEMYWRTLRAALSILHPGQLDVWLLDEGDSDEVKAMCRDLGVHHFSRKGVPEWNTSAGQHRARTKHGNINAWVATHGTSYDFVIGADPDHVPLLNFAERLLGYFRDPDVAFVVGPQVYGNYDNPVTKGAESQQYLFHSLLQRAGNRYHCAMLVGVNYAIRVSALLAIGGQQDSITEDMATSVKFHSSRNPKTGKRWKSVFTPDVLAVGEGPACWTDYLTQQARWSQGNNQVLRNTFWRVVWKMSPGARLHYGLLMSYYPTTAIAWMLGAITGVLYTVFGAAGLTIEPRIWIMLYTNAAVFQLLLYFWNRQHNVSPHETVGSSGIAGMAMSVLSTPIYVASLVAAVMNREKPFVVTPKGDAASPDRLATFRTYLLWAAIFGGAVVTASFTHYDTPTIRIWLAISMVICLTPVAMWQYGKLKARFTRTRHAPTTEEEAA